MFPSLGSAVDTLLEALDRIEITEQSNHELQDMASDLPQWTIVLSAYLSDSQPEGLSKWIKKLTEDLLEQAEYIISKQQVGLMRRLAGSKQEIEELQRIYRRIETSFNQLQTDAVLTTWKNTDNLTKELRLNKLLPVHDARYDSSFADKIERGGCFQDTRVSVLKGIRGWIDDITDVKIYWMNGMAGTGKTTIAYSVCTELERDGSLGASYFCSRTSSECQDVGRIIPTIAYQLAQQFYPFRSALYRALGERPSTEQRKISVQFESLIKNPLLEVKDVLPSRVVIVIDALDECSDPKATELILDTLLSHAADLPIKLFLSSRPEPSISNAILSPSRHRKSRSVLYLHNVEEQFVKADIETYLTVALGRLSLTEDQIKQLAERAGILFIYAATVVRYLLAAGRGGNTSNRLKTVLNRDNGLINKKYREIDQLYTAILDEVLKNEELEADEVEVIKHVLWTVVCAREPIAKRVLAALLKVDSEQVWAALQPLQSVLRVSEGSEVASTLHASFPEFMFNSERSGSSLYCHEGTHNGYLAIRCFELMKEGLRFNICGLETSYRFDQDVPDLKDRVTAAISPELFYASQYWADHLRLSATCDEIIFCLRKFLYRRLLFWMEVLNLKERMDDGPKMLTEVYNWLMQASGISETRKLVHDARNFVTVFAANAVRRSTPHIYLSALPFMSRQSELWEAYRGQTQGLLHVDGSPIGWIEASLAVWMVEPEFSEDIQAVSGRYYIKHQPDVQSAIPLRYRSPALQERVRILLEERYSSVREMKDRSLHEVTAITCVALSPNGTRIVFGSVCALQMYDAYSGTPMCRPLKGHTRGITCAVFSPDGTCIASGSSDFTIRVWDAKSGTLFAGPFDAHTDRVTSIAFSPDGTYIISSSNDCTIRRWDVGSGSSTLIVGSFRDHTEAASNTQIVSPHGVSFTESKFFSSEFDHPLFSRAVTFMLSPDGSCIAYSFTNHTIQIWDASNGNSLAGPLKGHTGEITTIAFSSNSTCIASGSYDRTIRVWDVRSGTLLSGPLTGHDRHVMSIAFSPDNARLVSGSYDCSIRVWDVSSGTMFAGPFHGHAGGVTCVAVSPDGTRIVSGSAQDYTIRLWNMNSNTRLVDSDSLNSHTKAITSVSFSSDNTRTLSGSDDCTTRMWDVDNGTQIRSFRGHSRRVRSVAFSPDGTRIISGSDDCTIRMWSARSGTTLAGVFEGHTKPVTSVAFSPNGNYIGSGSDDCTVRLWHVRGGSTPASPLKGHTNHVTSVAFSSDGGRIASGSFDRTIRVWHVESGTLLAGPFDGHTGHVMSVAFSPDGTRIASGSRDHTIRVWGMSCDMPPSPPFEGHTQAVISVAFSPDGTRIVSGSADCTIRLWDVNGDAPTASLFRGHTNRVTSVSFSPDGTRIVSGSWDGTIRVWEILSECHPLSSILSTWVVSSDGWAIDSALGSPLLWLPIGLRDVFPQPPAELIIRREGSVGVRWTDNLLLGESWHQCYDSAV